MSNDLTVHESKVALVAGGRVSAIIPQSIEEVFRLADGIQLSGLAPGTMNTAAKIMVAIMAGAELGLPPFQALQSFYVINNKPTLWGDAIPALLWTNGFKIKEWYEGEGDDMVARCEVTRPDGEVIPGEFSIADAKAAKLYSKDGPWQTARKRMLKMRARAFAARDGASDVLKGFQIREEVEDYGPIRDITPQGSGIRERLDAQATVAAGFAAGHVEATTVRVREGELQVNNKDTAAKPSRGRRKAAAPETPKDGAQTGEPADASQDADGGGKAEHVDQEIGEVTETGPQPSDAQSADEAKTTAASATDASTGSQEESSGQKAPSEPTGDGAGEADETPSVWTGALAKIDDAKDWLAVKQVLKTLAKTGEWSAGSDENKTVVKGAAWNHFAMLQDEGKDSTEVEDDFSLFTLWLQYGAETEGQIETLWPKFERKSAFKDAGEKDKVTISDLMTKRKAELKG